MKIYRLAPALLAIILSFIIPNMAHAAKGAYSLHWAAADPAVNSAPYLPTYPKLTPGQLTPAFWNPAPSSGTGRAADPLSAAVYGDPKDSVESLMPSDMALGQIVPFELRIEVAGSTAPENGTIVFTPYFNTKTTSGGDFGFDPAYGIYSAFVDTADLAAVNGSTARVSSYSWSILNAGTSNEKIQGPITVTGLQDGDTVIVEIWVVLKATIPAGATGNVQTGLGSATTVYTPPATISTGNQTVPLLQVGKFFSASADVSVTKSDSLDPAQVGDQITYTIVVTNNSTTTIANGIVVTDTLDANTTFVSASGAPYTVSGQTITFSVGALNQNNYALPNTATLQVVVTVGASSPNHDTTTNPELGSPILPVLLDIDNHVTFTAITSDPDTTNNGYYQPTNILQSNPAIQLEKSGVVNPGEDGVANAGDTISYSFTVTNTGDVTLTNVAVTDPKVTVAGGPITLAPGAADSTTFTGSYALTQADIDAGQVANTATASGNPPSGDPVTDDGSTITYITQSPAIQLEKSGVVNPGQDGVADAGDTITYSFTVTNTGNVTLTNVTITDPKVTVVGGPITLAPGASDSTTFTGNYTLTQADIDAGEVANTATAHGTPPAGDPVTDDGSTITYITQAPSIQLEKSGVVNPGQDGVANAGDAITYSFTVTNTGNVTLTNVTVTDPKVTVIGGPITLAPGAVDSTTFTGSYTLTQSDIDAGQVANTATAHGTPPSGGPVTDDGSTITYIEQAPAIQLEKNGVVNPGHDGVANAGDTITYTFTVTNTGNVTLTNVTVTDLKVTVVGGPITLAPGASDSTTFTGSYTLTQADIDAGQVANTATVYGTPPSGDPVTDDGNTITYITQAPSIQLEKGGIVNPGQDGIANAGDTITYTFTVTNTGNVTLTNVTVTDPKVTVVGGLITLVPGATDSTTFTGSYMLTQADIDAGQVENTATGHGTPPSGDPVSDDGSTITYIEQAPSIQLEKSGIVNPGQDGVANAGDTITYTFTVTNTGNVTLTNVTVTDPKVTVIGGPITLAPGASDSTTFTGSYTLTQADIDAGQVENTATAYGTPPIGDPVSDDGSTVTYITQVPSILLEKSGVVNTGQNGVADAGDTITYSFTVTNTGNVTLTAVTVTDPKITVVGGPITLAPGASDSTTFTGSYTLAQADIDAGKVENTATAHGTPPSGDPVTDDGSTVTEITQVPAILLEKSGVVNPGQDGVANAGDTITYTFTVTNTGNVTLSNITVTDPKVTVIGGPITLAPAAVDSTTFTGSYTLTQADIDAGNVENTATAQGTPPIGDPVSDDGSTITYIEQVPSILLEKSGVVNPGQDGVANAGDTITYTFTVTNTGNVTLTNVTVTDPKVAVIGDPITLAPGASDATTFTGSYTLTQADIDAGQVENTATASGNPPSGDPVTDDGSTITYIEQVPSIQLDKSGIVDTGQDGVANAGDTITYSFTVTNTGNVTLTNISITDPKITVIGGPITLAPGASDSTTFTGSYTLTQADIDAGQVENTATAYGTPPIGDKVSDDGSTITTIEQAPAIQLEKSGVVNAGEDGVANAGDTISYTFTVTNTGNVTLTNVTVVDPKVTVIGGPITLAPGATDSTTFAGSYTLTQADIDAGQVANTATASGNPPSGDPVTDDGSTITYIEQVPSILLEKSGVVNAGQEGVANAGDTITYTFTVTNTGNVTLTNVTVADPKVTVVGGPITLAPGATDNTTFTGSYVLAQADIDAGQVENTATASGNPPSGDPVSDDGGTITYIEQTPAIQLEKSGIVNAGQDGVANAGDTITYTFVVTNTGNVTLTNVTVTDLKVTVLGGPITLAPGASDATTFTGSYILTQADIDAGQVENTATAYGTPPGGDPVTDDGSTITTITQAPSIDLVKTGIVNAGQDGVTNAGDTISYTFVVTNTGNVTLTNVTVTDPKVAVAGGPITLAPGAVDSTTFTGSYTLAQADIDAGQVENTATAHGTPPSGDPVTDDGSTITYIEQAPSIQLEKSGVVNPGQDGVADAGDTITYTFTVTNTGNVTLTNVTVTDPKVTVIGGPITLAPGAVDSTTFTGNYALTQADIDAGQVENTATASGNPPSGDPVADDGSTITYITQAPAIQLEKSGVVNPGQDGLANPGDTISYTFTITNTGNVTLTNVTVTDPKVTVIGGPITLAPGAMDSTSFTGSYPLTQADIDAGQVENTATAYGTPPVGDPVSDDGSTVTTIEQDPSIVLEKSGVVNPGQDGVANPGDTISYTFTVTNTSNITLTNVTITDPKVTVIGGPITLAPGASDATTFTGSYTLTQADIDAGRVENTATAYGTEPNGEQVTDDGSTITYITQAPSIQLEKSGILNPGTDGIPNPGDTITYTFTVTNTGNVTLTNVTVTDPKVTVLGGPVTLAPGAVDSTTFTGSYAITQADIDAGQVENTATAYGTPPVGDPVTDDGSTITIIRSLECFSETAWAAENKPGQTRFVPAPGDWATYVVYKRGMGTAEAPKAYPLYAGQKNLSGYLSVYDAGQTLYVRYAAIGSDSSPSYKPGYTGSWAGLTEYHLEVVGSFDGFNPVRTYNKKKGYGNPIPGAFQYKASYAQRTPDTGWIAADISGCSDNVYIAAHGVMWWCGYPIAE